MLNQRINNYEVININTYLGRKHFLAFKDLDTPTYAFTTELDISLFYAYIKKHNLPAYLSLIYLINNAVNKIPEFRLRYVNNELRLYEYADPGFTIMTDLGKYDNCDDVRIHSDYQTFIAEGRQEINRLKDGSGLLLEQNDTRYDYIFYSSVPWIELTSLTQVMNNDEFAYIPRIAWDKFKITDDKVTMHLFMQVHHAVIDGYPAALAVQEIQKALNDPKGSLT